MLELFLTFARIGLFTFGGGYAMISLIEDICVQQKQWLTQEEMVNIAVVAESTPGPIAINCATYVGFLCRGIRGAAAATLGVVMPSFFIIYLISLWLDNFLEITIIASAFRGIKLAVGLLVLNAGLKMLKKAKKTPLAWGILLFAAVAMLTGSFQSMTLMLMAGLFSFCLYLGMEANG